MKLRFSLLAALPSLIALSSSAAEQTVTLAVPGMNCAACPITVKKALGNVAGVTAVRVDLAAKTATVTYDDGLASPAKLAEATADAGYPATVRDGPG